MRRPLYLLCPLILAVSLLASSALFLPMVRSVRAKDQPVGAITGAAIDEIGDSLAELIAGGGEVRADREARALQDLDPCALEPGYTAEWFVAPGAFNMPQEVLLTPQGDLLVHAVRANTLFRVADNGVVTPFATDVAGYVGDVDAGSTVYLYDQSGGILTRVTPDGQASILIQSAEIQAACDSGFGFGPDGNMYVALDQCGPTADLISITPAGQITLVAEAIPPASALRTAPDGRFLGAFADAVFEISLEDNSRTRLGVIPEGHVSPSGLAVDDAGNIYVSTGARRTGGYVYRIDASGMATLLATVPDNGLSGIEWLPDTDEIVGGQLRQGSLIAVGADGALREIVPGNGLVTPMGMACSPDGDLAVANDDGAMMTLVDPKGKVSWFFDYISFTPPEPFVAFAPGGTLYASEGAPGNPGRVIQVPPGATPRPYVDAAMPSGLAMRADGSLLVSETSAGRITQVNPDKSTTVLADGLNFPQGLALDASGSLYAVTGPADFVPDGVFTVPGQGDTIIHITPGGVFTMVSDLEGAAALAVGPSGDLFAGYGAMVVRVLPDGTVSPFAVGFYQAMGLAFDLAGDLYVSDADGNGIARISGFPQGTLAGAVIDVDSTSIEGARVHVLSDQPIVAGQVATTSVDGQFSLPAAPRTYTVTASASGYWPTSHGGVVVTDGETTTVNFTLDPCNRLFLPLVIKGQ